MLEEVVERMQLELAQGQDRIVAPSYMGAKITGFIKDLNRNLLPNLSLLEFDEVITCENVLAKTRQALEDGDTPLVLLNKQLESSSQNFITLLDSAGFPLVVKSDDSFPLGTKLDVALGEFTPNLRSSNKSKTSLKGFQPQQFTSCTSYPIFVANSRPTLDIAHLRMIPIVRDRPQKVSLEKVQCMTRGTTKLRILGYPCPSEDEDLNSSITMKHGRFSNNFFLLM
eukprot:Gb_03223 [translate_table: standard]